MAYEFDSHRQFLPVLASCFIIFGVVSRISFLNFSSCKIKVRKEVLLFLNLCKSSVFHILVWYNRDLLFKLGSLLRIALFLWFSLSFSSFSNIECFFKILRNPILNLISIRLFWNGKRVQKVLFFWDHLRFNWFQNNFWRYLKWTEPFELNIIVLWLLLDSISKCWCINRAYLTRLRFP